MNILDIEEITGNLVAWNIREELLQMGIRNAHVSARWLDDHIVRLKFKTAEDMNLYKLTGKPRMIPVYCEVVE